MANKQISRKKFEEVCKRSSLAGRIYDDVLSGVNNTRTKDNPFPLDGYNDFAGIAYYSPNPQDYLFGFFRGPINEKYHYTCLTRLWQPFVQQPLRIKTAEGAQSQKGWTTKTSELLVGIDIVFDPYHPLYGPKEHVIIGATCEPSKTLRTEAPNKLSIPRFWSDRVEIRYKKRGKFGATFRVQRDCPRNLGGFISRGILNRIYQNCLFVMGIKSK